MKCLILASLFLFSCCTGFAQKVDTAVVYTSADSKEGLNNLEVAELYDKLGKEYAEKGEYTKAIIFFNNSLNIKQKTSSPDSLILVNPYNNLGNCFRYIGKYQEAISLFFRAISLQSKAFGEDHISMFKLYNNLGAIYEEIGNYEKAIAYEERALAILKKEPSPNALDLIHSLTNLGATYGRKADFEKSIDAFKNALEQALSLSQENSLLANCYGNLGWAFENIGEFDEAYKNIHEALSIRLKLFGEIHPHVASSYDNLASIYGAKGDFNKAINLTKKSIEINSKILPKEHLYFANALQGLGVFFCGKDDYEKGIEFLSKTLDMQLKLLESSHIHLAYTYRGLGYAYFVKNEYEKAIMFSKKALTIYLKEFGEIHPNVAEIYSGLGDIYASISQLDSSLFFQNTALSIGLKLFGEEHLDIATAYEKLGDICLMKSDYQNFIAYQEKSLNIRQKKLDINSPLLLSTYNKLSAGYYKLKNYDLSFEFLKKSKLYYPKFNNSFQDVQNISILIDGLKIAQQIHLSQCHLIDSRPQLDSAHNYALKALAATEYQQNTISSEGSKAQLTDTNYPIYESAIETSLLISNLDRNDSLLRTTFDYPERSKAAMLRSKIKESEAISFARIPDSLLQQEYELRIDIAWRERQRQEKMNSGLSETDSTVLALSSKIFDLRQKYDTLKSHFEKNYPEYYRLKYDLRTVPLDYVQDSLLQPGQSLLEYFVGDSSIYLFLVQPKNYEVIEIKKDTTFEQWVEDLTRNGIYGYYGKKGISKGKSINNFGTAAYQLYETLIAPLKTKLPKDEKLIIIPDGILGYIPFEALLTQKPPRPDAISAYKYLIQDHQISYCYSATLLKEMRNKKHRQEPAQKLLAMAPFFLGNADTLLSQVDSTELIAGITLRDTLTALPNSGEEVARIQKNLKGQAFYGKAATLAQFQKLAAQARILHLSTHGKADDRMGDYAYLAFGMPDADGTFEKLYARDLYNLSLNADLVVLSACETGIGKLQRGEGIVSLARAFAYAGAKSIVTTLWKVSDEQSKNLMTSFYRYLGKGKDEALRLAKLDFLQKNEKKIELLHPFFWASFIGIGDMSKIK